MFKCSAQIVTLLGIIFKRITGLPVFCEMWCGDEPSTLSAALWNLHRFVATCPGVGCGWLHGLKCVHRGTVGKINVGGKLRKTRIFSLQLRLWPVFLVLFCGWCYPGMKARVSGMFGKHCTCEWRPQPFNFLKSNFLDFYLIFGFRILELELLV